MLVADAGADEDATGPENEVAVMIPVMLILPVPVMDLLKMSKLPPS